MASFLSYRKDRITLTCESVSGRPMFS